MNTPSILTLSELERARMIEQSDAAQARLDAGEPLPALTDGELLGLVLVKEAALAAAVGELQRRRDVGQIGRVQ